MESTMSCRCARTYASVPRGASNTGCAMFLTVLPNPQTRVGMCVHQHGSTQQLVKTTRDNSSCVPYLPNMNLDLLTIGIGTFLLKHCTFCACGESVFFFLFFLLLGQTWQFMPRKGWTSFPTLPGWYEVIRGLRPKSEEWPRHQQWHPRRQGWWPAVSEPSKPRVQRRWQRGTTPRAPDDVKAAARRRIERLQSALDAFGETESSEAWGLQAALKEAERTAKERPLVVQVEECQAFIKRSPTCASTGGTPRRELLPSCSRKKEEGAMHSANLAHTGCARREFCA